MPFARLRSVAFTALTTLACTAASAQGGATLNLYSARHYQTDEALYANFTRDTGIKINRIDADDAGILARLKAEGSASPADVILLVDAARLWRAEVDGLFLPIKSKALEQRIPATLRGKPQADGLVWVFHPRACGGLQQGHGESRGCRYLRRTGRPEKQRQGLHPVRLAPL
jgi:iron(III) transport system substrate-binding protein